MKNKKLISILCACSLLFVRISKSYSMSKLESNNLIQESCSTSLSKSDNITQEQECNELKLESNITTTESDSISIWQIGMITSLKFQNF